MIDLTRHHIKRLRFYWQNRGRGGSNHDGIDLDLEAAGLITPNRIGYDATPAGVQALPDDGRYTPAGCVPYTLSQVSGLPFDQVLAACRARGWDEQNGMSAQHAIALARDFGLAVRPGDMGAGNLTLRRFLDRASPRKRYIVATKDHWLAVVHGSNRDMAETGMRAKVYEFWEVDGDARLVDSHCREFESCS